MSQPQQNYDGKPDIRCPECYNKLPHELLEYLKNGQTIYCEICGFPFVGLDNQGEVKPLEKSKNESTSQSTSHELTKQEKQWLEWKKEWNNIKDIFKSEWQSYKNNKKRKKRLKSEDKSQAKITTKNSTSTSTIPSTVPSTVPITGHNVTQEKTGVENALDILVILSPIYYAFIIFITILSLARGKTSAIYIIGSLIVEIFVVSFDIQRLLPNERENSVPYVGIPQIILGALSNQAFGIGVFLLARGILNILKFIQKTKNSYNKHPAIGNSESTGILWFREVVISFIFILNLIVLMYFFSGIFYSIHQFVQSNQNGGNIFYFVYSLVSSVVVFIIFETKIKTSLKNNKLEQIPINSAIGLIIIGALTTSNGFGVPLLISGILIIVYQEKVKYSGVNFPKKSISEIKFMLVATKRNEFKEINDGYQIDESNNLSPAARFDPETGKPLQRFNIVNKENPENPEIIKNKENKEKIFGITDITKEVYTVLEPEIRHKLISLELPEEERNKISKSLIYLTIEQQSKYLDEINNTNKNPAVIYHNFVKRIKSLQISVKEQEFLIKQLEYLPSNNQEDFVSFIEKISRV